MANTPTLAKELTIHGWMNRRKFCKLLNEAFSDDEAIREAFVTVWDMAEEYARSSIAKFDEPRVQHYWLNGGMPKVTIEEFKTWADSPRRVLRAQEFLDTFKPDISEYASRRNRGRLSADRIAARDDYLSRQIERHNSTANRHECV